MKILITGIAGCGKSTVIKELQSKGHVAIDLDTSGVCGWINKKTGKLAEYVAGAGKEWIENHRWQVLTPKLVDLLNGFPEDSRIFVGGKISKSQADEMASIFEVIYLLKPHDDVIDSRLSTRTSNIHNFGKEKDERGTIIQNRHEFEKECLKAGAIPLENHGSVQELVEFILSR